MSLLQVNSIVSGYGTTQVLHQVSLKADKGQVVALMGRNGVGKTTLLKTLMGLIKVESGSIEYDGANITQWPTEKRAHGGIAYVPQGREIFPHLTVYENLILGLAARSIKNQEIPDDIFIMFPELKKLYKRKGGDLSGGQQQQLAIARMLILDPKLILFDEPTEGIQPSIVQSIEYAIRAIKEQQKITIILVEQYMEMAFRLGDFCYVMDHGEIVMHDNMGNLEGIEVQKYISI
ncbi:MAG: urea ABC transporter ATP-binding subunit UrtE [Spirochaetales bacterium]|nr:urea ABC transporter ATP-binding subunit UrtE [Spirochaetales bacterium]